VGSSLSIVPALAKLSEGQGRNRDKYPVFNTEENDPQKFWDSLNKGKYYTLCGKRAYRNKADVGSLALHQGFMGPNTCWDAWSTKYKDLSKKQQKIIIVTLKCKDEPYTIIGIRSLCGNLFRV
jgi:hypothetical protein